MNPAIITLLFLAFAIVMFVTEKIPLGLTSMIVCVGLIVTGVLGWKDAFAGFIDSNVILFVAMFVVGGALFETGMANKIGGLVTKFAKTERSLIIAIMLIVGLMSGVLSNTGTAAILIPVVIGIILLANGLLSIQKAFNLKKAGLEKWWLEFLLALLTSVLGIIICTNPFDAVATTNIFIGICLIYSGISDLVTTYYMGRAKRRIKNVIQTEINQQKILHDDNVIDVDEDELH